MRKLGILYLNDNLLKQLPEWIDELGYLSHLYLQGNSTLTSLHPNIALLDLASLNCGRCYNLTEPPYAVCGGGLSDVKQYYQDLADGKTSITLSTLVLLGRKEAGKSTLLNAMKKGFQISTDDKVEKTRVFEFQQITLRKADSEDKHINVIDFGGDDVYHYSYQITVHKDCIPVVVVNLKEYEDLRQQFGKREATRRVAFDWLSHLITISSGTQEPIFVITHKDLFEDSPGKFENLCTEFCSTVSTLRDELISEVGAAATAFKTVTLFSVGKHVNQSVELKKLQDCLFMCVEKSECSIPNAWLEVQTGIINKHEAGCLDYNILLSETDKKSTLKAVLSFMQRSGQILWYANDKDRHSLSNSLLHLHNGNGHSLELRNAIFHDIPLVAQLIGYLYDHNMTRGIVMQASDDNTASSETRDSYLCNGIISKCDLEQLFAKLPKISQFKIFVDLLLKFRLLFGPTKINELRNCYLLPYFMPKHTFTPHNAEIPLKATLNFHGLRVPDYGFQQLTVSFIEHVSEESYHIFPHGNGVSAKLELHSGSTKEQVDLHLIHEIEAQKIFVSVEGCSSVVHQAWQVFISLLQKLAEEIKDTWPASLIRYEIPCPHCLILDKQNPALVNSDPILQGNRPGDATTPCTTDSNVPRSLLGPCSILTQDEIKYLEDYLRDVKSNGDEEIKHILRRQEQDLSMLPIPQKALNTAPNTERVYRMTATRGRALVINVRSPEDRKGSQYDYENLRDMFEKFGFIISGLSGDKDWSAQELIEAIHEETNYVDRGTRSSIHTSLGMFVLVLMSHGDDGSILTKDADIKLVDIYRLLSSNNFPAMAGKPKMIILQSCSGDKEMRGNPGARNPLLKVPATPSHANVRRNQSTENLPIDDSYMCMDDLIVFKPSFPGYVAYRDENYGSLFVQVLVLTFYKQAGQKHAEQLSKTIQSIVRELAPERGVGQLPVTISTFTNERKLYLSPGVNMRTTHPDELHDPVL